MKALLKLLAAVVLLVVIAAVTAPFLIPVEMYKREITERVHALTGRELAINGQMQASVFPTLGIVLNDVTLSNPEGFSAPHFMEMESLTLDVALKPLLARQVEVKRLILESPVIHLETNVQGKPNWEFTPPQEERAVRRSLIAAAYADEPTVKEREPLNLRQFRFEEVRVKDGMLTYREKGKAEALAVERINAALDMPSLSDPAVLSGEMVWNEKRLEMEGRLERAGALLEGKDTPATLQVKSELLSLTFNGTLNRDKAEGQADIASSSLKQAAVWLGADAPDIATPLAFSARGKLSCTASMCAMEEGNYRLDHLEAAGEAGVKWGLGVPTITAAVTIPSLDLVSFFARQAQGYGLVAPAYAFDGWSNAPLDFSGLRAVNAEVKLDAGSIRTPALELGETALSATLTGGLLGVDIAKTALFGGSGKGVVNLDASGQTPAIKTDLHIAGTQVEPLLTQLIGERRLKGTGDMAANVTARGNSMREWVESLSGTSRVDIRDGAIRGVNLAQMVRNIKAAFTGADTGAQQTDFSELGASFVLENGVLKNDDLMMKAPLLRLRGQGSINLPAWSIAYRLVPEIVGTLKGQGGKDKQGLAVPVVVEGSLSDPKFRPDLQSVIQETLENPEAMKEKIQGVKEQLKENKGGLKDLKQQLKNPETIQNLLKGFGG